MFLWSAGVLFPSEFHGINLDSGIYAPPSSSWVLCPFPSPPPLQLVLVSSDSASLVEKKQEPVVMNIKNKVTSRRLLKTDKTHGSPGHAYPARQSPSAPKILASSCLNTLIDELITYLMTVKHNCRF